MTSKDQPAAFAGDRKTGVSVLGREVPQTGPGQVWIDVEANVDNAPRP